MWYLEYINIASLKSENPGYNMLADNRKKFSGNNWELEPKDYELEILNNEWILKKYIDKMDVLKNPNLKKIS